jgi:nitroreductase
MDLLEGLFTRRSVRKFTREPVSRAQVLEILRAGSWAPSGLNNQPWRFAIVFDAAVRGELAKLTRYGRIIRGAPVCLPVFADRQVMYHETKDHQSMGACIENLLLAAHGLGLGAVWLGEILKSADEVRGILGLPASLELMAVVAVGHPAGVVKAPARRDLDELIVREI